MKYSKQVILAMALIASVTYSVQGSFVNLEITSGGLETFTLNIDGTSETGLVGGIRATQNPSGNQDAIDDSFVSVCTDLQGTLFLGRTYGFSQPTEFTGQDGLLPPWGYTSGDAQNAIQKAADIFFKHGSVLSGTSSWDKAALQLAVWEALYDTGNPAGYDISSTSTGRFEANGGDVNRNYAINLAESWLAESRTEDYAGYLLIPDPESQYHYTGQALLYHVTPVPEPSTIIAGALLLLPFGLSTIRIMRKDRSA